MQLRDVPFKIAAFSVKAIAPALLLIAAVNSQESFQVTSLQGTAKVQRAQKRDWTKLSVGDQLNDNDIVETFFQSRLIIEYGSGDLVIFGPNSKGLLNISRNNDQIEFKSTLFNGGLFIKSTLGARATLFTSNGVAETDSGSISAVFESKTGHTGFQILGGNAHIRNIAQQEGKTLSAGHTTIIRQGKEPTAALYITRKHVGVLKHYFGSDYIEHEMQVSNIKPTEEKGATNRMSMSSGYGGARAAQARADMGMYKKLFSRNTIYGRIIDDRLERKPRYQPIIRPDWIREQKGEARLGSAFGIANNSLYPRIYLGSAFSFGLVQGGIRIPLAKDATQSISPHFGGLAGILEKIEYLSFGRKEDSTYLYIGNLRDLTMANGLVVDRFSNANPYSALRPPGLLGHVKKRSLNAKLFLADLSFPAIGGISVALEPGAYSFGAGYYFDFNQFNQHMDPEHSRFISFPDVQELDIEPSIDNNASPAHMYELSMAAVLMNSIEQRLCLQASFAQKVGNEPGFSLLAPRLQYQWSLFQFGGGFLVEQGAMISPYFHSFYMSNRNRLFYTDSVTYIRSQGALFSSDRYANGLIASFGANFFKGTALDVHIRHDFATRNAFLPKQVDTSEAIAGEHSNPVDSVDSRNNFSIELSMQIDERLVSAVKYGCLFVRQMHGGYYPDNGTYFGSWGLEIGGSLITAPLFAKIAFEAGVQYSFLDLDIARTSTRRFNNIIDNGDSLFEFWLGLRWGFL